MRFGSVPFHFASGRIFVRAGQSGVPPDADGMNADKLWAISSCGLEVETARRASGAAEQRSEYMETCRGCSCGRSPPSVSWKPSQGLPLHEDCRETTPGVALSL